MMNSNEPGYSAHSYEEDEPDDALGEDPFGEEEEEDEDEDEDKDKEVSPDGYRSGEHDVNISRELDADGNEIWSAEDSQVPGGSSIGHSLEEAMDGMEERRNNYREMLRRSRKEKGVEDDDSKAP